jgi:hypothetical protein
MTTTLTTSPPTLEERLADAEKEVHDAEEALGVVVYDGGDESAARKRAEDAQAAVNALHLALDEGQRRAAAAAAAEAKRREAINRWMYVSWHAEYIKRAGPVLRLRAELRAAEENAMELVDLTPAVDPEWIRNEEVADRLERFNLPRTTTIEMHVHGANQHCGGHVPQARTELLSVEDTTDLAKRLATLVAQAAKPLGKDAKPENLPWQRSASPSGPAQ